MKTRALDFRCLSVSTPGRQDAKAQGGGAYFGLRWQSAAATPPSVRDLSFQERRGASLPAALQTFASLRLFAFALILLPLGLPATTNDLTSALQRGLFEEEANRNLEAAAQAYQAVSTRFDQDRKLAATAIFRLGEVYRKQGKTNEATAQYERIVREFSDQSTLVTLSRQNITGLGIAAQSSAPTIRNGATLDNLQSQHALLNAQLVQARMTTNNAIIAELFSDAKDLVGQMRTAASMIVPMQSMLRDAQARGVEAGIQEAERNLKQTEQRVAALRQQILDYEALRLKILESAIQQARDGQEMQTTTTRANETATDDEEKEIRRIQAMIQNSPDLINAPDPQEGTSLFQAATKGQLQVAGFLLDHGAAVNAPSGSRDKFRGGWTPLIAAANGGHKAMAELLLNHGADVDAKEAPGSSPLYFAAKNGFAGVAEVLLAHKANVNLADKKNAGTPLHFAADAGRSAMMELLLRSGANVSALDNMGQTPLTYAARGGQSGAVKVLLAAKADPNAQSTLGRTALSHAAENGHPETVKILLEAKADPNTGTLDLPLAMAVRSKQLEIAGLLLRAGAKPDLAGKTSQYVSQPGRSGDVPGNSFGPYTPLQIAVSRGDVAMVKLLFTFKADANSKDPWNTARPLVSWAVLGDAEMLRAFLEAGANPNAEIYDGWPMLMHACSEGDTAATELLLAHGAKVDGQRREGRTALSYAAEKNFPKCVELLLAAKAEANAPMRDGTTALHLAAHNASKEMVESLVAHSANVNLKNQKGETPLHWAVRIGKRGFEVAQLLLSKGADPNVRNNDGQTPLDWAKAENNMPGMPPPPPGAPGVGARSAGQQASPEIQAQPAPTSLADLLRKHGALDDLPKLDRIEVRRPSANYSAVAFQMGTNGWNEFSLLELIALHYGLISTERNAVWGVNNWEMSQFWRGPFCQFPDLGRVVIRRPSSAGPPRTEMVVNVVELLDSGDCARDVKLKPGDIIEIPEADHPVNEQWVGLCCQQLTNLLLCVSRTVTISIKGTPTTIRLAPEFKPTNTYGSYGKLMQELTRGSFMLKSVLAQSRLLRASSDLSSVKVTRRADAGGQKREWVLNCSSRNDPDLWLRDGDVIEVPDKP